MFLRKYWIPITVFIVAICAVGLYYLQTQPPKDPIVIYKPVEPLPKSTEQPPADAPVGDTSQGGHIHADGTWHEGPHEPVETPHDGPQPETPISLEEEIRAHQQWLASAEGQKVINAAYKQAGLEPPPPNHYYVKDEKGVFQLHSIFEPVVQIRLIDGFAPTPAQLERYLYLQESLSDAMRRDAHAEVDAIRSEIETLRSEARGKVPQAIGSWMTKAAKSKVDSAMKEKTDQAYRDLGLGHMVEAGVSGLPEINPTVPH